MQISNRISPSLTQSQEPVFQDSFFNGQKRVLMAQSGGILEASAVCLIIVGVVFGGVILTTDTRTWGQALQKGTKIAEGWTKDRKDHFMKLANQGFTNARNRGENYLQALKSTARDIKAVVAPVAPPVTKNPANNIVPFARRAPGTGHPRSSRTRGDNGGLFCDVKLNIRTTTDKINANIQIHANTTDQSSTPTEIDTFSTISNNINTNGTTIHQRVTSESFINENFSSMTNNKNRVLTTDVECTFNTKKGLVFIGGRLVDLLVNDQKANYENIDRTTHRIKLP